jgi:hypothetical protein
MLHRQENISWGYAPYSGDYSYLCRYDMVLSVSLGSQCKIQHSCERSVTPVVLFFLKQRQSSKPGPLSILIWYTNQYTNADVVVRSNPATISSIHLSHVQTDSPPISLNVIFPSPSMFFKWTFTKRFLYQNSTDPFLASSTSFCMARVSLLYFTVLTIHVLLSAKEIAF